MQRMTTKEITRTMLSLAFGLAILLYLFLSIDIMKVVASLVEVRECPAYFVVVGINLLGLSFVGVRGFFLIRTVVLMNANEVGR